VIQYSRSREAKASSSAQVGFVNIIEHRLKWNHQQVQQVDENGVDAQVSGDTEICNQQSV
jgi:hypothetical protein